MGQEERLELLEKELEAVKLQLARAQAVTEIANTMARYNYYPSGGRQRDCLDQFAMRTPGVAIEIAMWGQYHEAEGLYENYVEGIAKHEQSIGARKGWYCEHPIYNPLIEVAADCKTAKAEWQTFGPETAKEHPEDPDCPFDPNWMYGKYQADFIVENGHWKIWHLQIMPDIMCPTCKPFTEQRPHDDFVPTDMPGFAERQKSFCEEYDVNKVRKFWPQPPEPYETFEGSRKHALHKPTAEDKIEYTFEQNDFTLEEYFVYLEEKDPWKGDN